MPSRSGSQRTNQKKPKHLISADFFFVCFSASFLIQIHLFLRYIFNFLEFVICARWALSAFVFHWLFFSFLWFIFPFFWFLQFYFFWLKFAGKLILYSINFICGSVGESWQTVRKYNGIRIANFATYKKYLICQTIWWVNELLHRQQHSNAQITSNVSTLFRSCFCNNLYP